MSEKVRRSVRVRSVLLTLAGLCVPATAGCDWSSEVARRFREAYGPGLVEGLSAALTNPTQSEAGLRRAGAALLEGLGAIIEPRTPSGGSRSSD